MRLYALNIGMRNDGGERLCRHAAPGPQLFDEERFGAHPPIPARASTHGVVWHIWVSGGGRLFVQGPGERQKHGDHGGARRKPVRNAVTEPWARPQRQGEGRLGGEGAGGGIPLWEPGRSKTAATRVQRPGMHGGHSHQILVSTAETWGRLALHGHFYDGELLWGVPRHVGAIGPKLGRELAILSP